MEIDNDKQVVGLRFCKYFLLCSGLLLLALVCCCLLLVGL